MSHPMGIIRETKFLRTHQVAEILGISEVTVRRLLREKKLPGVHIGRLWLVEEAQFEEFVCKLGNAIEAI